MAASESSIRAQVRAGVAGWVWIEPLLGLGLGAVGGAAAERTADDVADAWRVAWWSFRACFWPVLRPARDQPRCGIDLGCGLRACSCG